MLTPTTHEEVTKVTQGLQHSAAGMEPVIAEPLTTLIINCFEYGMFLDQLKTALFSQFSKKKIQVTHLTI